LSINIICSKVTWLLIQEQVCWRWDF